MEEVEEEEEEVESEEFEGETLDGECEPVTISMCSLMPYNMTLFPNSLGHQTQQQADMEIRQFLPLVNVECSPHLRFFLCSVYAPVCTDAGAIPPCRQLCEGARSGCEKLLERFGFQWPESLECDQFPSTSDNSTCVLSGM